METFHHRYPTLNSIAPALIETEMIAGNPQARPDGFPLGASARPKKPPRWW